jgi:hypothetical protein
VRISAALSSIPTEGFRSFYQCLYANAGIRPANRSQRRPSMSSNTIQDHVLMSSSSAVETTSSD